MAGWLAGQLGPTHRKSISIFFSLFLPNSLSLFNQFGRVNYNCNKNFSSPVQMTIYYACTFYLFFYVDNCPPPSECVTEQHQQQNSVASTVELNPINRRIYISIDKLCSFNVFSLAFLFSFLVGKLFLFSILLHVQKD